MIARIKGTLHTKEETKVILDVNGIAYEIHTPLTVASSLPTEVGAPIELIIYHYLALDKSKGIPVLIGFKDELERDFFEKFISISGIGPKAALKAFHKPIPAIARAIEDSDVGFLTSLPGIGQQKARQIIAQLQGKVGRFALLRVQTVSEKNDTGELAKEAQMVLKRLQYSAREVDSMIKQALTAQPQIDTVEDLLNQIYLQKKD